MSVGQIACKKSLLYLILYYLYDLSIYLSTCIVYIMTYIIVILSQGWLEGNGGEWWRLSHISYPSEKDLPSLKFYLFLDSSGKYSTTLTIKQSAKVFKYFAGYGVGSSVNEVALKLLVCMKDLTRLPKYVWKHFISHISAAVKTEIKTKHWHKHMEEIYKAKTFTKDKTNSIQYNK